MSVEKRQGTGELIHGQMPAWAVGLVFGLCPCLMGEPNNVLVRPPDLSDCNRLEIKLYPTTLKWCFRPKEVGLLINEKEQKYLESLKTIVCEDKEAILCFSRALKRSLYFCQAQEINEDPWAYITTHHVGGRTSKVTLYHDCFIADDGYLFKILGDFTEPTPRMILDLLVPQIVPFNERRYCANRIRGMGDSLRLIAEKKSVYPSPEDWCDSVYAFQIAWRSQEREVKLVRKAMVGTGSYLCRGARASGYAINPNCKPNSPPDMVLLFETKAGWNQSGGPELFTFDNHEPKGGCVLFNDGSVRFIRTKEELRRLRWK